jgi:hypothetical protein
MYLVRLKSAVKLPPLFILGANGLQIRLKIDFRRHVRQCSRLVSLWYAIALNDLPFYIALSYGLWKKSFSGLMQNLKRT